MNTLSQDAIIIDNGSYSCKAGFAEDDMPRVEIPTVVGKPNSKDIDSKEEDESINQLDIFVGEEANNKGGILELDYPIKKGRITNFDNMKKIWNHIFYNELPADVKLQPVIVSESPFATHKEKYTMAQILFEELNVESLYITNTSTLSLYANGRTTGIVVDIGYEMTSCVPIYEGFVLNHAITKMEMGGKDLTDYLCSLVNSKIKEEEKKFRNKNEISMINSFKEKVCVVAEDYDSEHKSLTDKGTEYPYKFPESHNRSIKYNYEMYKCPEMLFQPNIHNINNCNSQDSSGVHELCFRSINRCNADIIRDLYLNTVLCGGSTLFMKIQHRFNKELQSLAPTGKHVNIIAPPERKFSAWLGGSILASLSNFRNTMFITRKDFLDNGEEHIYNKFY